MRLYYGSTLKIELIDLGCSRNGKDFGRGFYLSDNYLLLESKQHDEHS